MIAVEIATCSQRSSGYLQMLGNLGEFPPAAIDAIKSALEVRRFCLHVQLLMVTMYMYVLSMFMYLVSMYMYMYMVLR